MKEKVLWSFCGKSDAEYSFKMALAICYGLMFWIYKLGGWTVTIYHEGEPFLIIEEWW